MINVFKQLIKKYILPEGMLLTRLPVNKVNEILLTFDDGPDPEVTPMVLDLLAQYKVKAIFFIPGRRIKRAPELLAEIVKQGHEIGNHTFMHSNGKQPGFFTYWQDIKKCQKMIIDCCGVAPRFFRPPCGIVSLTTLLAPRLVGLKVMTWSLDVHDWQCKNDKDAADVADDLIRNVQEGDIVLLHDDNINVIKLLEIALPALDKKKYIMRGVYAERNRYV